MTSLTNLPPKAFVEKLTALGQHRAYFVFDAAEKKMKASHSALEEVSSFLLEDRRDFDQHEGVFLEVGARTGALHGAFVHRTKRGQSAGGVRHWPYDTLEAYLRDGLRLARGMGRKNALAGLWWGGGKGVIAHQSVERSSDPAYRRTLYREYGAFVTSLRGCYVTAEDAGTLATDMAEIFRTTRFVTCIPTSVGGSGNPSFATAKGVVCAVEGALDFLDLGPVQGKRVAMQGVGNVGAAMIQGLLDKGATEVVASEINPSNLSAAQSQFRDKPVSLRKVDPEDTSIFRERCDIFVPNALGGVLNDTTIPLLQTKIVCGGANNQLLDDSRHDKALADRGITYVPDFVANRMGIVNCANEQYGSLPSDPAIERHLGREWENAVFVITKRVLERAQKQGITTAQAANALADEMSQQPHPLWGHRSRAIIDVLVGENWHEEPPLETPS